MLNSRSPLQQFVLLFLAIGFVALFAQITIEVPVNGSTIPISGQTFAVLLVGFVLGKIWGTIALFLYVVLGALGAPIFADGEAGWEVILGGSGGYLLGFIISASLLGYLAELNWGRQLWMAILAMFLGTSLILFLGVCRLAMLYDFDKALQWGFYPFIWGGLIKVILGGFVAYYFQKWFTKKPMSPSS